MHATLQYDNTPYRVSCYPDGNYGSVMSGQLPAVLTVAVMSYPSSTFCDVIIICFVQCDRSVDRVCLVQSTLLVSLVNN